MGEEWAARNNIPVELFPADWDRFGRSAGHRRNADMAARAEALVALWDGKSPGTKGMIDIARQRGLKVHVQDAAPKARNYIDVAEGETP
jgi:hypothetical protein